jgi:hypothetical protein
MIGRRAAAMTAALTIAAFALLAGACASSAESPSPSEEARTAVAAPTVTSAACPTPPASDVTNLGYSHAGAGGATLVGVETSSTACADRITFTFTGGVPAYDARYVPSVTTCGKGDTVTTQGAAQIAVKFTATNAHNDAGTPTAPRSLMPALPSLKEAQQTCDFEAVVSYVLGTAPRYFTVSTTAAPPALVVEIAH